MNKTKRIKPGMYLYESRTGNAMAIVIQYPTNSPEVFWLHAGAPEGWYKSFVMPALMRYALKAGRLARLGPLVLLAALLTACANNSAPNPPPSSVLLVGDSVTHGYAAKLVPMLPNIRISIPADNCRNSWYTSANVQSWLNGAGLVYASVPHADVVVWNNGLWNAMAITADNVHGRTDADYVADLRSTLGTLLALNYRVIFTTTTDIPAGAAAVGFIPGKEVQLNALAKEALPSVQFIELYGVAADKHAGPADVHFTDAGYTELAATVARALGLL